MYLPDFVDVPYSPGLKKAGQQWGLRRVAYRDTARPTLYRDRKKGCYILHGDPAAITI